MKWVPSDFHIYGGKKKIPSILEAFWYFAEYGKVNWYCRFIRFVADKQNALVHFIVF